jgi:pyruvate carboxylase
VTGIDLVRLQIEVAEGKPLPARVIVRGAAIEARLNAEDPLKGFLPATGTAEVWRPPAGVRVDTAIETGTAVGVEYDSLLAKIICAAQTHPGAAADRTPGRIYQPRVPDSGVGASGVRRRPRTHRLAAITGRKDGLACGSHGDAAA